MRWNWQLPEWPHFTYDASRLSGYENRFLCGSGVLFGAFKHLGNEDKQIR